MLFKVKHKEHKHIYDVYEIIKDEKHVVYFLLYIGGTWQYCNANEFEPYYPEEKCAVRKKVLNEKVGT